MGDSLQSYRARIGTFNSSVRVKTNKEQTGTKSNIFSWNYKIILMMLLFGLFVGILLNYWHEDLIIATRPTQNPTTTACDPSSGPLCTHGLPWIPPHVPPNPRSTPPTRPWKTPHRPPAAPPDYAGQTFNLPELCHNICSTPLLNPPSC